MDYDDLPRIHFPATVRIGGNRADFSGEVAGIHFSEGVSTKRIGFAKIMQFTAGFEALEHEPSGIVLSPLYIDQTFVPVNRNWNQWQGTEPEFCDRAIRADGTELLRGAVADVAPVAGEGNDDDAFGLGEATVVVGLPDGTVLPEVINPAETAQQGETLTETDPSVVTGDEPAGETAKVEVIVALAGDTPGVIAAPAVEAVTAIVTEIVSQDDAKAVSKALEKVMRTKGARTLRQYAETRGITAAHDGKTIVKALVDAGVTLEEAKAL